MNPDLKHIAIILDGNRRFAKRLNLDPWKGHEYGEKKVQQLMEWCQELRIKELTLYAFSMQNFDRPKTEFEYLMKLFLKAGQNLLEKKEEIKEKGLKIRYIGRKHLFPENIQKIMNEVEKETENNNQYILNIAFGYGGKEEIEDAIKKIAQKVKDGKIQPEQINENTISQELYIQSKPDLIIRTGGAKRTSNFLPWQSIYSEWIFLDKHWPEFEKEDLITAVKDYKQRERRFGK